MIAALTTSRLVRRGVVGLLSAAAAALPGRLQAQRTIFIPVGNPVRVTSTPFSGAGFAASSLADTLTLIVDQRAAPVRVPLASVTRLEARLENSPRRMAIRRGVIGFLAGTAVWGLSHAVWDYDAVYPYQRGYTSLTRGGAFVLFAGSGATVGAVWGALRPGSRWERASPPIRVRVVEP